MRSTSKLVCLVFAALMLSSLAAYAAGPQALPAQLPTQAQARVQVPNQVPNKAPARAQAVRPTAAGLPVPAVEALTIQPSPQSGPCTPVECSGDYYCQQYCGLAGGRCGFFECPGHCYCFF